MALYEPEQQNGIRRKKEGERWLWW